MIPLLLGAGRAAAGAARAGAAGSSMFEGLGKLFGAMSSSGNTPEEKAGSEIPTLETSPTPNIVPIESYNESPSILTSPSSDIPKTQEGKMDYIISITDDMRKKLLTIQSQVKLLSSSVANLGKSVSGESNKQQSPIQSGIKLLTKTFAGSGMAAAGLGALATMIGYKDEEVKPVSKQLEEIKQGTTSPEGLNRIVEKELGIDKPAVNSAAGQQVPSQERMKASNKTIEQAIIDSPKIKEVVEELEKSGVQVDKSRRVSALPEYITRLAFKGQEQPGQQPGAVNSAAGQQLPTPQQQPTRNLRFLEKQMESPSLVPSGKQSNLTDSDTSGPVIDTAKPSEPQQQSQNLRQLEKSLETSKVASLSGPTITEHPSVKAATQNISEKSNKMNAPIIMQPVNVNNNYSGGGQQGSGQPRTSGGGTVRVAYNTPADYKSYSPSLSGVI